MRPRRSSRGDGLAASAFATRPISRRAERSRRAGSLFAAGVGLYLLHDVEEPIETPVLFPLASAPAIRRFTRALATGRRHNPKRRNTYLHDCRAIVLRSLRATPPRLIRPPPSALRIRTACQGFRPSDRPCRRGRDRE